MTLTTEYDQYSVMPTKTYKIDWQTKRIYSTISNKEAVIQFITKVLNTDKYAFEIYDWYYGNKINELVGQNYEYVVARIPAIIEEALLTDDRITKVRDFEFTHDSLDYCTVKFWADTVYGSIEVEKEIKL